MIARSLSLLVLFASASAAAAQPAAVTVQVQSFSYNPTPIHLKDGVPTTLTFINAAGTSHDFTAKDFFAHSKISAGAAPGGEIDLKGHETKTITLVPQAGTYHAHCSHFMHKQMGMETSIIVN